MRPSHGLESGGAYVLVCGEALSAECAVFFGDLPAAAVNIIDEGILIAVAPPGVGEVAVAAERDGQRSELPRAFAYVPAARDDDGDGLTYETELARGTDPFVADSDDDALADSVETNPPRTL